jgi:hypothetical protein
MKRYFMVPDERMPQLGDMLSDWHSIDLGSHGDAGSGYHLVVLMDDNSLAPTGWEYLPPLSDQVTAIDDRDHHLLLADLGVGEGWTTIDVARLVSDIALLFEP